MYEVDMHTHSHYSDGSESPREIVRQAKEAGLKAVCLTDHDAYQGLPEFLAALKEFKMDGLPGIEMSSVFENEVLHILGYGIRVAEPLIVEALLRKNWQALSHRITESLRLYREAGIMNISVEEMNAIVGAKGPAALKLWLRDYRVRFCGVSYEQAKAETKKGGLAFAEYDRSKLLTSNEAIHIINMLGGLAFWAHSGKLYRKDKEKYFRALKEMKRCGLMGLEVEHLENSDETEIIRQIADEHFFVASGGSDFHGRFKPKVSLGIRGISYREFLEIKNALILRHK